MIWRSVQRDANTQQEPITIRDVYDRTKSINESICTNFTWSDIEHSIVAMTEEHRLRWPLSAAKMISHLKNLPYGLADTPSITSLINIYIEVYETVRQIAPVQSSSDCDAYYKLVRYFLVRRLLAIPKICHGLLQKSTEGNSAFSIQNTGEYLTAFIDRFASQRMATRVFSAHYLCFYEQIRNRGDFMQTTNMGLFEEDCDVMRCIQRAVMDAAAECEHHFVEYDAKYARMAHHNFAPRVHCYDKRHQNTRDQHGGFVYIPQHLHHVVFEIMKNSMRAVLENNPKSEIKTVVVDNPIDGSITIKVSDIGGGIPRSDSNKIWRYGYTTGYQLDGFPKHHDLVKHREVLAEIIAEAETHFKQDNEQINADFGVLFDYNVLDAVKYTPFFGLGYGLAITKLYCRMLGGDCRVQSLHGYGTDAYLSLINLRQCNSAII